jgi:ribosomal protein L40E
MAPLLLEQKHDENNEKTVEGIMICIKCGSQNTTNLTKVIYCRDCRIFKLFGRRNLLELSHKMEIQE